MKLLGALVVLICSTTVAYAGDPPFGPPPKVTSKSATLPYKNMLRWWGDIVRDGTCPLKREGAKAAFSRMATNVEKIADAKDKKALSDYYNNKLMPYMRDNWYGVPGYGKWKELEKKRAEGWNWLADNEPKVIAVTAGEKEIRAFVKASAEYSTWAGKQHEYASNVLAKGLCKADNYDKWRRITEPATVEERLAKLRADSMPKLDLETASKLIAADAKVKKYERLMELGNVVRDAASAYVNMGKEQAKVDTLKLWGKVLGGEEGKAIAKQVATHAELRKKVGDVYAKRIAEVAMPAAKPNKKLEGTAKKLVRKAQAVRVTTELKTVDQQQSEIVEKGGKKYLHKWREVFQTFDVYYVSKEKPFDWFTDIPGVPLSKVCTLRVAGVFKYKQGYNVKLGSWLLDEDNAIAPMLCANKSKSY